MMNNTTSYRLLFASATATRADETVYDIYCFDRCVFKHNCVICVIFIGTIINIHSLIKLRPFLTSRRKINTTITCQWKWQINNQKELLHGHYARAVFVVSRAALVLSIFNARPLRRTGLVSSIIFFCNNWSWPKYMAGLTPA